MTVSVSELQAQGEYFWFPRWLTLFYADPNAPNEVVVYRRALDMNADGAVTVSDVTLWLEWLFWLPGDYFILALMRWAPSVAHFMELGLEDISNRSSTVISCMLWPCLLHLGLVAFAAIFEFFEDIWRNGI